MKDMEVFKEIKDKFDSNFEKAFEQSNDKLLKAELCARAFPLLGVKLNDKPHLGLHQKDLLKIFDEIFSDFVVATYLASCAMDKPAQIILRRTLELSITVVYLWDRPHEFWGWKEQNIDLSFSNMLAEITNRNYISYIKKENPKFISSNIIDHKTAKTLYGKFSDVMHGRITTFESVLGDRFTYTSNDWDTFLDEILDVQKIAFELYQNRFYDEFCQLLEEMPALKKYINL